MYNDDISNRIFPVGRESSQWQPQPIIKVSSELEVVVPLQKRIHPRLFVSQEIRLFVKWLTVTAK